MATKKNRETWLNQAIIQMRPMFKQAGAPLPLNVRVTCGFPSKSAGRSSKQRVGECWSADVSGDQTIEIIVSMVIDDDLRALDILAHELVHAAVGLKCGHKGPFKTVALKIGLTGKMTATVAGPGLPATLKTISANIGPYPHAAIDFSDRKRQTTRMVKVVCADIGGDCGMVFRTTRKWVEHADGGMLCPACHGGAFPE